MSLDALNVKFVFFNLIFHNLGDKFVRKTGISLQQVHLKPHGLLIMGSIQQDDLVWNDSQFIQLEGLNLGSWVTLNNEIFVFLFTLSDSFFENLKNDIIWNIRILIECCLDLGTEISLLLDLQLQQRSSLNHIQSICCGQLFAMISSARAGWADHYEAFHYTRGSFDKFHLPAG